MIGDRGDLQGRIPEDVKARAARAGAAELDWYAGRLKPRTSVTDGATHAGSIDRAEKAWNEDRRRRQAERPQRSRAVVSKIVAFFHLPRLHH
jgi:hypothetical protein